MKLAPVLVVIAMAGPAFADDVVEPVPAPTGLQVGMRMPWDVTLTPNVVGIGMLGFGLDLGERVTDRLYLGVTTDYTLIMNIQSQPGIENRFRGGVEARYYFHEGTATMGGGTSGECCCYVGEPTIVARYDWMGLRFGEETVDEFTTHGTFADVSLGTDAQISPSAQLGMYISAGLTSEPASVYTVTEPSYGMRTVATPEAGNVTSYYFTLGLHMAFGG